MMVLPHTNFLGSMLPLNPQIGYWDKLHSLVTGFICNNKRSSIKFTTPQREKSAAGSKVPNHKVYYYYHKILAGLHTVYILVLSKKF